MTTINGISVNAFSANYQYYGHISRASADARSGESRSLSYSKSVQVQRGKIEIDGALSIVYEKVTVSIDATMKRERYHAPFKPYRDFSPEAVSSRIAGYAAGLYGNYRSENPIKGNKNKLDKFMETIKGAFEKGYREAMDILKGLDVSEDVNKAAERTYDLFLKKLNRFYTMKLSEIQAETSSEPEINVIQ
jgi:hypothetical protein